MIKLTSALDFELNSPESAELNASFQVLITAETSETYDVKIFVQDNEEKIISQIFNEGWKNPFYYLKSIFPQQKEFKIQINKFSENAQICARLRKSGSSSFNEKCNEMKIIKNQQESEEKPEQVNENKSNKTKESKQENKSTDTLKQNISQEQEIKNINYQTQDNEKIILNSKSQDAKKIFTTKNEKIRIWVIYSFTALCIIIIILLALKRL